MASKNVQTTTSANYERFNDITIWRDSRHWRPYWGVGLDVAPELGITFKE